MSWTARARGQEGAWFAAREAETVARLRASTAAGAGPGAGAAPMSWAAAAAVQTKTKAGMHPADMIFEHVPGRKAPTRFTNALDSFQLGTRVTLGRGKWATGEASVFRADEGRRLAQLPAPALSRQAVARQEKVAAAALDAATHRGLIVFPKFTPGRAFLWGTILAVWGTGVAMTLGSKTTGVKTVPELETFVREASEVPMSSLKGNLVGAVDAVVGSEAPMQALPESQFVRTLKGRLT